MSLCSRAVALLQKQYEVVFKRMRQCQWTEEFGTLASMINGSMRGLSDAWQVSHGNFRIEPLEPRLLMTTLYWDADAAAGLQAGSAAWDTTATNWNTAADGSGTRVAWINGADAVFSASGTSTVTISSSVTANTVKFSGTGYTIAGGTLTLAGSLAGSRTIITDKDAVISSVIGGSLSVKSGNASLWLSGNNTYSGDTYISFGAVFADHANAFGSSSLSINSGATLYFGTITKASIANISGNGTIVLTNSQSANVELTVGTNNGDSAFGLITGTGNLVKVGTGTLALGSVSNYVKNITITEGTVQWSAFDYWGDIINNGNLTVGTNEISDRILWNNISGSGSLTKAGAANVTLAGVNTYTGTTYINKGRITLAGGSAIADTAAVFIGPDYQTRLVLANSETIGSLSGGQSGYDNIDMSGYVLSVGGGNADSTYGGEYRNGVFNKIGSGTLTLTGDYFSGATTVISAGTLCLKDSRPNFENIINNASLVFDGVFFENYAGIISGSGSLTLVNHAMAYFTMANNYKGTTTIGSDCEIAIFNGSSVGTGNLVNNGILCFYADGPSTIANTISGNGRIEKRGLGALTLSGSNTFAGITTIYSGTLILGNADALSKSTLQRWSGDLSFGSLTKANIGSIEDSKDLVLANASSAAVELTVGGNNSSTILSGILSGAGSLVKTGTGTFTLTGNNTYSGTTSINDGELQIGFGGTAGTLGTGDVIDNGRLTINRNTAMSLANSISGSGSLNKQGIGTLSLSGTNTFTGSTTINGGTLVLAGGSALSDISAVILANEASAALVLYGNETIGSISGGGTVGGNTYLSNFTLTVGGNNTSAAYAGAISGRGGLNKIGTGTEYLYGNHTYTGVTTIASGGTLQFFISSSSGRVGAGNIINNGTLIFSDRDALTISNVISGGGNLVKSDTGVLTLTGANTYTGTTTINAGTLQVGNGGATGTLGSGAVINNGNLTVNRSNGLTISSNISGSGSLSKSGNGYLTLSGTNTYTGTTTINAGTLILAGGAALSDNAAVVLADVYGTTLVLSGNETIGSLSGGGANGGNVTLDSYALTVGGNNTNTTYGGIISGTGSLVKVGTGVLTLTGTNAYTGTTTINAGTLKLGDSVSASGSVAGNIVDNATLLFASPSNQTYAGIISGSGSVTISGVSALTLTGTNTYTGTTTISSGGTLRIDGSGSAGIGGISNGGTLIFKRNDDLSVANIISGNGNLIQDGVGALTLNGANTYTGITIVNTGTLVLGNTSSLGGSTFDTGGAGILSFGTLTSATFGGLQGNNILELANASSAAVTLTVGANNSNTTFFGILSGAGSLNKTGTGTLTLTGANTYTGTTTINTGTLQIGNGGTTGNIGNGGISNNGTLIFNRSNAVTLPNSIGGSGNLVQSGTGILALTGDNSYTGITSIGSGGILQIGNGDVAGNIGTGSITNDGTLVIDRSNDLIFANMISGSGTLTKNGTGNLTLSGSNTFTGTTTINAGTLTLAGSGALSDNAVIILADVSGATLVLSSSKTVGSLSGGGANGGNVTLGNYTLTVGGNNASTSYGGTISGTGSLVKVGTGVLTLTGANSYTGTTTINAGTLKLGDGASSNGSVAGNIVDNATLAFAGSSNQIYSGVISGSGNVEIGGSWTLTLTGANTYTGTTSISSGSTLQIGNGGATGSISYGAITNNGTLIFNRSNALSISNVIAGSGDLIQNGAGILTLTNQNTFTGITIVNAGKLELGYDYALFYSTVDTSGAGTLSFGSCTTARFGGLKGTNNLALTNASSTAVTLMVGTNNSNTTFSGILSGAGSLYKGGTGTLTLLGSNSYTGTTTIEVGTGTLQIGDGGTTGSIGTGSISNNGTLIFNRSNALTITNVISGMGNVIQAGTGVLTLSGANTYTGTTRINGGTLTLANINALSNSTLDTSGVGILSFGTLTSAIIGCLQGTNNLALSNASSAAVALTVGGNGRSTTFSAILGGNGSLIKTGAGTLILAGSNTYTGSTTISAGTLQLGDGLSSSGSVAGNITDNAALVFAGLSDQIYSGIISGSGTLTAIGMGTLILTGANTYTGVTSISSDGTLQIGNGGTTGSISTGGITNNGTLIFNRSSALTVANVISGSGDVVQAGAGVLTLAGANTYTGTTIINAGTLTIGSASALGGSTLDTSGAGTLSFGSRTSATFGGLQGSHNLALSNASSAAVALTVGGNNQNTTFSGILSGTGSVIKTGTGTLTLTGANIFTGTTTISAGTLQLGDGLSSNGSVAGNIANSATLVFAEASDLIFSKVISGTGTVAVSGPGALILAGANTYTGVTSIGSGGTLQIGNGGTTGSISTGGITNNGTLIFNRSSALSVANVISGSGNVVQAGAGVLTLAGANTYTGTTIINAGTLTIGSASALGGSTLDTSGAGTLSFGTLTSVTFGGLQGSHNLALSNASSAAVALTVGGNNQNTTFSGILSGTGSVIKTGSGALTLTGANTYTGTTTISTGTLQIGNGGTTGGINTGNIVNSGTLIFNLSNTLVVSNVISGSGSVVQKGVGTLTLTGANTYTGVTSISFDGTLQIGNGGTTGSISTGGITNNGTLIFNRSSALSVANVISGSGNVVQAGAGVLTLAGANTYTGTTIINAGTLTIGSASALGGSTLDTSGAGTLSFGTLTSATFGGLQGSHNLALSNASSAAVALTVGGNNQSTTFSGILSGTGSLIKTGTGTLTLTGANIFTGTTTISAGTLQLGDGGTTGSIGTGNISNSGTLIFNRSNTLVVSNVIGGSGNVVQKGAGVLILTGANIYTGATNISSGSTLQIGNGGTTGSISTGGITNNGTLIFNRSGALTVANVISGSGNVVQAGAGVLTLTGTNTYTGTTTINAGTLQVGNGGATGTLGSGAVINNGNLTVNRSNGLTISGNISGSGSLSKSGNGYLTLSGTNTYTGTTTVNAGTLTLAGGAALSDSAAVVLAEVYGATLVLSGNETIGSLSGGGANGGNVTLDSYTLTVGGNNTNTTYGGTISGTGGLVKVGTGVLTLTGANSYTGTTIISAGTLQVGNGGTAGTLGAGAIINNSSLIINNNSSLTLFNLISGDGSLTKAGTAALTLMGTNTYTGATNVESGSLWINGGGIGSTVFVVDSGASLYFSGGNYTLADGAVLTGHGTGYIHLVGGILNLMGNVSGTQFLLDGGELCGGKLTLTGNNGWNGSTIYNNLTVAADGTLEIISNYRYLLLDGGTLENFGTINWTSNLGNSSIRLSNGAKVNNFGVFDFQADAVFIPDNPSDTSNLTFTNNGSLTKTEGSGVAGLTVNGSATIVLNNDGTVNSLAGTLVFDCVVNNTGSLAATGSGILVVQGTTTRGTSAALSGTEIGMYFTGLGTSTSGKYTVEVSKDGIHYIKVESLTSNQGWYVIGNLDRATTYHVRIVNVGDNGSRQIYDSGTVTTLDLADISGWYRVEGLVCNQTGEVITTWDDTDNGGVAWSAANAAYIYGSPTAVLFKQMQGLVHGWFFPSTTDTLDEYNSQNRRTLRSAAKNADITSSDVASAMLPFMYMGSGNHFAGMVLMFGTAAQLGFTALSGPMVIPSSWLPRFGSPGNTNKGADGSKDPILYSNGAVDYTTTDLLSNAYGSAFGITRSWTNQSIWASNQNLGTGMIDANVGGLVQILGSDSIAAVTTGKDVVTFNLINGQYIPNSYVSEDLIHKDGVFILTDASGTQTRYYDFSSSTPTGRAGTFISRTDAAGNQTFVAAWTDDGKIAEIDRADADGTVGERWLYSYLSSGDANAGLLANVQMLHKGSSGQWQMDRQVSYSYYNGADVNGNKGDLKIAVIQDGAGNTIDTTYYRYYTLGEEGGYSRGLKYIFDYTSFARLSQAFTDPFSATDAQVASYAVQYFEYDPQRRVTRHDVQTLGSSDNSGIASCTYQYFFSTNADGANSWRYKTIETFSDGSTNTVYCNSYGQMMLKIFEGSKDSTNAPEDSSQWMSFYKYDDEGHQLWYASASAITGTATQFEQYADLLHYCDRTDDGISNADYEFLSDHSGVIYVTNWYTSTTATQTTAGGVKDYMASSSVRHGELGSDILISTQDYVLHSANGITINPLANYTVYGNPNGTGAITTSYNYEWYVDSLQAKLVTVALPTVTAAQNGLGASAVVATFYNIMGRPTWTKDANGHIRYTFYDAIKGAVLKTIDDVKYSALTAAEKASFDLTGWAQTSGLNQVTSYEVDGLGRTTKITDPKGNVSYITYDDVKHETRTYQGWNALTNQPTGVVIVKRDDRAGSYTETLTYTWNNASGVPVDANGIPTGTELLTDPRAILKSLSRTFYNNSDQIIEKDEYFNLSGLIYSTDSHLGSLNTNYYATYYGYDANGNLTRVKDANGTISIYIYDSQSRLTSEYVGTNDTTTDGKLWQVGNAAASSNMKLVTSYEYDNNGVGDGNLTKVIKHVDANPAHDLVTQNLYDWRDRLIATKSGVQTTEDTNLNRALMVRELDNLGQILSVSIYDADGLAMADADANGVPDALANDTLRTKTVYSHDSWGRVYRTEILSVNQTTGVPSSSGLVSQVWYDQRGNLIKEQASSGLVTKYSYDGLNRLVASYDTDGGGDTTWADAGNVVGDTVLDQDQYVYDANGNIIEVIHKDRFHNATGTGELGDANSGVRARVSYTLSYYDALDRLIADVSVGTNGGVLNASQGGLDLTTDANGDGILDVLQGTVPTRSDNVLVGSYTYTDLSLVNTYTDAKGIITKYQYDALGRQTAVVEAYTNGVPTNSTNRTTTYTYDGVNHVTSMTAVGVSGTNSQTTQYVYGVTDASGSYINSNNLLSYVMYPNKSTGAASTNSSEQVHYTYNALGQVVTATDQNGTVHTYTYDVLGTRTSDIITTLGAGVDGRVRCVDTAYDTLGNVTVITSFADTAGTQIVSQIKREYNELGQLTAEYQATTGAVDTATTPKVQYSYSDVASGSRLLSMTYPNGRTIYSNYNVGIDGTIGRLSSISDSTGTLESYTYLGLSTTVEVAHPETGTKLTYIQQSGDTYANTDGGDIYTGLERFGDVIDQNWIKNDGSTVDRYQYAYDRNGNVTAKNNLTNSALSELYTYDDLDRLTSTTRNGTTYQQWDLDSLGNSDITTGGVTQDRDFNSQNQIVGIEYDANGNTLTDEAGRHYAYDAWNHLVQVKDAQGNILKSYTYDALGRRVTETTGSGETAKTTTLYYNANWQLVEERTVDAATGTSTTTQYVWSATYIDAMVCRDQTITNQSGSTTQRIYAIHDANFNVTAIADASGQILERYAYDTYGEFTILNPDGTAKAVQTTTAGWNYLHQGGRYDATTGLYSFRNRDYNPETQRWMQQDPMGYVDGLSLYQYAGSDPINRLDPNGTEFIIITEPTVAIPRPFVAPELTIPRITSPNIGMPPISVPYISDPNPTRNPAQDRKLSPSDIKKLQDAGHDPEEMKGGDKTGRWDLFRDGKGNIYIKPKSGKGPGEPTGINLNDPTLPPISPKTCPDQKDYKPFWQDLYNWLFGPPSQTDQYGNIIA